MKTKLLFLILLICGIRVNAQTWLPVSTGVGDAIQSSIMFNGDLYVGGKFFTAGDNPASRIARWNGTAWSALGSGMSGPADGGVIALTVYNGELIAAGLFTSAGGVPASNIARWNGTSWAPLGSGTNNFIQSLTVFNGDLIAGGGFTTAGGVSANNIAKWNGSSWSALGTGTNGQVRALAVYNGLLYAGGHFTTAGSSTVNYIARWNSTTWQSVGAGMNTDAVLALTVFNGELYAGGQFTTAGGNTANYIARWNNTIWSAVGAGMNSSVYAISVLNNELYAAGAFSVAGATPANQIAKWNGSAWTALGTGVNAEVFTLTADESNNLLYAGGSFTMAGGNSALRIAKWIDAIITAPADLYINCSDPNASAIINTWLNSYILNSSCGVSSVSNNLSSVNLCTAQNYTVTWTANTSSCGISTATSTLHVVCNGETWSAVGTGVNNVVQSSIMFNGDLYAGGKFLTAGENSASRIARWNGTAWSPLGSGMSGSSDPSILAMTLYNGELIAAGLFTTAGGVPASNIAKWNGTSWSPLGSGMNNFVQSLTVYNGELIAGGGFTTAGGVPANNIARWNGSSWSALGTGTNSQVRALAVYNGLLYAGGHFTTAGSLTVNYIARWNGTTWQSVGTGMNTDAVLVLAVFNGELYAGGQFTIAGGNAANYIAKWNNTSWSPVGTGMNTSVYALTVLNNELYAGGAFDSAGAVSANRIARWNGTTWSALGSGVNNEVVTLTADAFNNLLYAGGSITTAGGSPALQIAKWRPVDLTAPADLFINCSDQNVSATINAWLNGNNVAPGYIVTNNYSGGVPNLCTVQNFTITWTASTNGCSIATATSTLHIVGDATPPNLVAPSNLTFSCSDSQSQLTQWLNDFTANDNCGTSVTVVNDCHSQPDFCTGNDITVTWTATDACGNTVTASSAILVTQDVTPPNLTVPANLTIDCSSPENQIIQWLSGYTADDNCGTPVTVVNNYNSQPDFCTGNDITVTWTATDACGNTTTASSTIVVTQDVTPPNIVCAADETYPCYGNVIFTSPTATDNCSVPTITVVSTTTFPGANGAQVHCRTWSASDDCGNSDTCNQCITVPPLLNVDAGSNETLYFGYAPDQCVSKTAVVSGGTPPYTYNWTLDRPLLSDVITPSGDESMTGANSQTVTVCLMDTAELCITITDANNCTATDCATIFASDVRCFAGNTEKVTMCHNNNTICVNPNAVSIFLAQGGYLGECNGSRLADANDDSGSGIFPNPFSTSTVYWTVNQLMNATLIVNNRLGQTVRAIKNLNGKTITLYRDNLPSGIYIVQLMQDNHVIETRKLFIID